jgi:hypothetical protein
MTPSPVPIRTAAVLLAGTVLLCASPAPGRAQTPDEGARHLLRLESTPLGALPPLPLPMPASRDHNYWVGRFQIGQRIGRSGEDLLAIGGGIELQYLGGSVFGLTAGYQRQECRDDRDPCGHFLVGAGARLNLIAGGTGTLSELLGDNSGTTTVGVETSFGYAPHVLDRMDACTVDLGVPISSANFRRVRLSTFFTPSVIWDLGCGAESAGPRSYRVAAGIGILQLGHRGLDVFLGAQRIFRSGTGYHVGLSIVYVHLP